MKVRKIAFILTAIAVAALCAKSIVKSNDKLQQQSRNLQTTEAWQAELNHYSPVVFATRTIKTGTKIAPEMIDQKMMANPSIPARTLWDKDLAIGMTARLDIKKGELLHLGHTGMSDYYPDFAQGRGEPARRYFEVIKKRLKAKDH